MRCMKCGYVTFDIHEGCPKCGKSVSKPIARTIAVRGPRRSGKGASYLSALAMGPVPRFFSNSSDPEVISPLGDVAVSAPPAPAEPVEAIESFEDTGGAAEDVFLAEDEQAVAEEPVAEEAEQPEAEAPALEDFDDLLADAEEPVAEEAEQPVADEPVAEEPEAPALEDFDDILAEAEEPVAQEPVAEEPAAGEDPADLLDSLEELGGEEALLEAGGAEAEEPVAEEPVAQEPVAGEDPADLLDSLEELGGEEAGGLEAEELEAAADVDSGGDDEEMSDLGAELGVEEGAEEGAPAEAAADSGDDESVDDMWADAFAEQEAAESGETQAAADEPAQAAGDEPALEAGDDDDISNMWDEAFAEQDAAEQQAVAGETLGEPDVPEAEVEDAVAVQEEGELAEVDDSDLEKLWDEALEGAGDEDDLADALEEGDIDASSEGAEGEEFGELPAEGEDIVGQDDLDSLLDEAQGEIDLEAGAGEAGAGEAGEEAIGEEDPDAAGETEPFGDEGEIEAFVDEGDEEAEVEAPAAAAEEEAPVEEEPQEHHEDIEATTQNRLVAGVVDTVLVGALEGLFMLGTHFIVGQVIDSIYTNMEALLLVGSIDLGTLFLLSLFYAVYFIGGWGRTPGLRVAGLVVVDLNDQPVGYMQAVLRYFGTLAALLPLGLGQILTLIGKQGRGLGDRLAGTKVIYRASL